MKGVKDEGKQMDHPLFPRFHVNDAEKGGPRAPPRNKMALSEQYKHHNLSTQNLRYNSGSMKLLPLPRSNGYCTYVQPSSSSNAGNSKALPPFCSLPGSSHSADIINSYYSRGVNLNISLKKSEAQTSGNANDQNPQVSGNSMRINDYTAQNYCKLQLCLDNERNATFSSFASGKLHNPRLNQSDETKRAADQQNHDVKISKFSQNIDDEEEKKPVISIAEKASADATSTSLGGNKISKGIGDLSLVRDSSRFYDNYAQPFQECRVLQESKAETTMRKRHASEKDDLTCFFSRFCDNNRPPKIDRIGEGSEDKDSEAMKLGSTGKKQEDSDTSAEDSIHGLHLTPDDVAGVIGQRLFWKARRTIVLQQKIFAVQIFELHRLVKVQKLITGSPEVIYENNHNLKKPSIEFPPMNKLLFVTPLDPSPIVAKPKMDAVKSNPDKDGKLPPPLNAAEKRHFIQPSASNTPSTSASTPTDGKVAPWCFYPPPGNQWLVPVRSPSEGLIYKPYTGLCPPSVGLMASVYGNYAPISLNTVCGTAYGVPAMTHQGNGRFSGVPLGQSYFQQYTMPVPNTGGSNVEVKQEIPLHGHHKNSYGSSQQSGVLSGGGEKLHGSEGSRTSSPAEQLEGDVLPLFPTTPSVQETKDSSNEPRVQVIKVVPHNPKSAPESAARIFRCIQEERKRLE